jgi:hypothetical protein
MEKKMRTLTSEELVHVAGGCECECEKQKCNNGWGNGIDCTNNGSDNGGTADTKLANPEGYEWRKFEGR